MKAYVFRSGQIEFGNTVPSGALPIIGPDKKSIPRDRIEAGARLAYDGKTFLVPGIPEASDDNEAYEAFEKWIDWLIDPSKYLGTYQRRQQ